LKRHEDDEMNQNRKGLTLLELILAMTMLSIILLASGSMNVFVMRAANLNAQEARLQNELEYILRDMEMHVTESGYDLGKAAPCAKPDEPKNCILMQDSNNQLLAYIYVPGPVGGVMYRFHEGEGLTELSSGVLIPTPGTTEIFQIEPNSNNKLVRVNLAAQGERYGKTVTIGGTSKLFLIRGGEQTA
jgi:prepilin-type N-terminal cleavage/methylation domain-containing protein